MAGPKVWQPWGLVLLCANIVYADDLATILSAAQRSIDGQQYSEAIAALEPALPRANGNERLLRLLRSAYRAEIPRLLEAGDRTGAQRYIDRLRILGSESNPTSGAKSLAPAANQSPDPVKLIMPEHERRSPEASVQSAWQPAKRSVADTAVEPATTEIGQLPDRPPNPSARVISAHTIHAPAAPSGGKGTPTPSAGNALEQANQSVKQADALFIAERYPEAAALYDSAHTIAPESIAAAHDRWVYSRLARAVAEINAAPSNPARWAGIQAELESVLATAPENEFIHSLVQVADRRFERPGYTKPSTIVRASEPDRPEPKETNLLSGLAARIGRSAGNSSMRSAWRRFRSGNATVLETSNFRIHAADDQLAGQIADIAESTRLELYKTWYGGLPESAWNPKCDIFVHDSADLYARITHQGPASPGHSQMGIDRGRITSRRVDLRRDGRDLVHAILPHEITHVVLADRFTSHAMPRWADEGMAVLTEPAEKKQAHLRSLGDYLKRGPVYSARQLMTMEDYPDGSQWPMFYAESVSLVEFLVGQASPDKFIEFMDGSLKRGYEYELKRVYNISSFEELDRAWSAARSTQVAAAVSGTASR